MSQLVLRLKSGLCLTEPVTLLQEKFKQWPWEKYDGAVVQNPNRVMPQDVERVYQLGARSRRAAYLGLIEKRGDEMANCLKKIPTNQVLEDDDAGFLHSRDCIIKLVNIVADQKYIKLAGATKLLSPFRPGLIPVIDSVVENYYWFALSIASEREFRQLELAFQSSWGNYVWFLLGLMRKDVIEARREIDTIRNACDRATIATISRVRVLESLIWYYYARGQN